MIRRMRLLFIFTVVLSGCVPVDKAPALSVATQGAELAHPLCLYGCPIGADTSNFVVDHDILLLSSNRDTKFADWVVYQVLVDNLDGGSRSRNWATDPQIPVEYTFVPNDYQGAYTVCGYDRGHQAPLATFSNNEYWRNTNYLSNITPQLADLNRGAWLKLENQERVLARNGYTLSVITGTYYTDEAMCELPNTSKSHQIPNGYWKIVAAEIDETISVASFIMPQAISRQADYCDYTATPTDIYQLTGLTFFPDYKGELSSGMYELLDCGM